MIVLYVDDDSDDREIFGAAINTIIPGVRYNEFEAGQKIIEFLAKKKEKPDYIFIDINMPKMNGYECAQEILSVYGVECSRIVMYSTTFSPPDIARFNKMGVHMLQKANTFDELLGNLRKLLAGTQSSSTASIAQGG
ncbi:MAG: response regulator [Bacteroidota bacterium]